MSKIFARKPLLLAIGVLIAMSTVVIGGTGAFFSDIETASGNTFTAATLDLSVGSTIDGVEEIEITNDIENEVLFSVNSLHPGDSGVIDFDLSATEEVYVCVKADITSEENGIIDPEDEAGDHSTDEGELNNFIRVATFHDEAGDGIYGVDDEDLYEDPSGDIGYDLWEMDGLWFSVADNNLTNAWLRQETLGNDELHAGLIYCFGDIDSEGNCTPDFMENSNLAQTDSLDVVFEFQAVQTAHNDGFDCAFLNQIGGSGGSSQQ